MRKILLFASISLFVACNSGTKDEVGSIAPADTSKTAENIAYPYTAGYSSQFAIGDSKHSQMILSLWKDWDNGNLSNGKDIFADSVEMYFADGNKMHSSRDSVLAAAQSFRNMYTKVTSTVDAFTALKSTDKDENWVCIWGKEVSTDKAGKVDSINLHEVWRINKNGKTDLVFQYSRRDIPKK
jgi:hypothetical protein